MASERLFTGGIMRLLKNRLSILERRADLAQPVEPVPVYFWPQDKRGRDVTLEREAMRAEIAAHESAGRKVIVFTVEDAS